MNSTFTDPRKVVVGVTMRNGDEVACFAFPSGDPSHDTLRSILAALIDGFQLDSYQEIPLHELPK
jgi:hypothetical protein